MKLPSQRTVFRWIHLILSIPILGYVYSPFDKLPGYAFPTRFIFLPVMVITGLWMWKGHVVRRRFATKTGPRFGTAELAAARAGKAGPSRAEARS